MIRIYLVSGDDWEGLYINGKLEKEGHRIDFSNGMKVIAEYINNEMSASEIKFMNYYVNQEWLEDEGSFPENFRDIPSDKFEE